VRPSTRSCSRELDILCWASSLGHAGVRDRLHVCLVSWCSFVGESVVGTGENVSRTGGPKKDCFV
jgi:hypothetical protein